MVQVKEQELTIQQMVELTGLSAHTLRYYERAGLMILEVGREDGNGYRAYRREHVQWIEFVKRLRTTGMPIRDIQRYTELMRQGDETMVERMELLKGHRVRVEARLREEEQHLVAIDRKIADYERKCAWRQQTVGEERVGCGEQC